MRGATGRVGHFALLSDAARIAVQLIATTESRAGHYAGDASRRRARFRRMPLKSASTSSELHRIQPAAGDPPRDIYTFARAELERNAIAFATPRSEQRCNAKLRRGFAEEQRRVRFLSHESGSGGLMLLLAYARWVAKPGDS